MKQVITVTDKATGKKLVGVGEIRNIGHFETQLNTKAHIFEDRRKRKPKHKNKFLELDL